MANVLFIKAFIINAFLFQTKWLLHFKYIPGNCIKGIQLSSAQILIVPKDEKH